MGTLLLNGALFADMIRSGAANLCLVKNRVNELNVFPIPDGDTGDNMYMTIESGASAAANTDGATLRSVSSAIARGMLLGARGNSGVILSRIFAGVADGFCDSDYADVNTLGAALENGVKQAYSAVQKPVEGTILTVYKEAVRYANARVTESSTLEDYFENMLLELRRSLDRTPELLDVLKEAGVVDSGGAGMVYIAEGMQKALEGTAITAEAEADHANTADYSLFTEDSVLEYGYCTEFLLRLQRAKVDIDSFDAGALTEYLCDAGESVVCFREGSIVKVHVHTMQPGDILNHCRQYGEFLSVKIENMTLQHNEVEVADKTKFLKPHKKYGVVAVAAGQGVKDTFLSLGVDAVVDGGQSMNPSSRDFICAFESISADTIFVFPGNGNILLAAKQAAEIYTAADVRVINCRTIGESYAALSMLDLSPDSADEIVQGAEQSITDVITGVVSRASRDAVMNGVKIRCGEYIGFVGDDVYSCSADRSQAFLGLTDSFCAENFGIMLIIRGKDAPAAEAEMLSRSLSEKYPRTETFIIDGGQPIYDYIITFE